MISHITYFLSKHNLFPPLYLSISRVSLSFWIIITVLNIYSGVSCPNMYEIYDVNYNTKCRINRLKSLFVVFRWCYRSSSPPKTNTCKSQTAKWKSVYSFKPLPQSIRAVDVKYKRDHLWFTLQWFIFIRQLRANQTAGESCFVVNLKLLLVLVYKFWNHTATLQYMQSACQRVIYVYISMLMFSSLIVCFRSIYPVWECYAHTLTTVLWT